MSKSDELPLVISVDRFIGKRIIAVDASTCNNIVFSFNDGSKVALHIDCDFHGLPHVQTCLTCVSTQEKESQEFVVVKCASHRARDRFMSAMSQIGIEPKSVWGAKKGMGCVYGSFRIPKRALSDARLVKGVSASRIPAGEWLKSW